MLGEPPNCFLQHAQCGSGGGRNGRTFTGNAFIRAFTCTFVCSRRSFPRACGGGRAAFSLEESALPFDSRINKLPEAYFIGCLRERQRIREKEKLDLPRCKQSVRFRLGKQIARHRFYCICLTRHPRNPIRRINLGAQGKRGIQAARLE